MAPALTYTSLPTAISTSTTSTAAASSSDYSFVFIIVAFVALFLGLGCYAYRAAHREQSKVPEITSEQCALHFIATKGQDILSNFYEDIPDGLLGKNSSLDEVIVIENYFETTGRARASSMSVASVSESVSPNHDTLDKGSHRRSQSLPITKFDAKQVAALTEIALLGEARGIDVFSAASDETIKTVLAVPVIIQTCADTTASESGSIDGIEQVSVQHRSQQALTRANVEAAKVNE